MLRSLTSRWSFSVLLSSKTTTTFRGITSLLYRIITVENRLDQHRPQRTVSFLNLYTQHCAAQDLPQSATVIPYQDCSLHVPFCVHSKSFHHGYRIVHLPAAVTTVNEEIRSSGVGGGVRCKVDVSTLQLLGETVTAHWDHAVPQLLNVLGDEVGKTSVNVSWRDGVDTGKVAPLIGERLGHVDAARLGDVVRGLLLWEVGNVSGHGRGDDQRSSATLLEVSTNSLGAVEGTVQVNVDDVVPGLDGAVKDTRVGSSTSVGDEGINLAELLDHVGDELCAVLVLVDLALVGLDLDSVLLGQLLCVLLTTLGAGGVGDGDVGTHLGAATGGLDTHSLGAGGTGNDDDLALEGQEVLELGSVWDSLRHDCGC